MSEKVETVLAVERCPVEAFCGADALLVVQEQAGTLDTAAKAEMGTGSGTAGRSRTSDILATVGVALLTQSVLVTVLAWRTFRYAVHAVLGIDARIALARTLYSSK